jgi:predicted TIM-barrel fold metal-dependent hydrolase
MNTIDFHTHVFPSEVIKSRDRFMDDPGFRLLYSSQKAVLTDYSGIADYIEKSNIAGAAVLSFPWQEEKYCLMHNEYMAFISGYTGIYPFGMIPLKGVRSIRDYVKEIKSFGLYGVGELAFYKEGMTGNSIKFLRELLEACSEYLLPLCLHLNEPVGHSYPGKYEPSLNSVYELLKEIQDAVVVLSHWGGGLCFYELMPEVRDCLKNVYYDTAATPFLYNSGIYGIMKKITGPDKIIFGSDYPLLGIDRYRKSIEEEFSSVEDRNKILYGNAMKVLGI